MKPSLFTTLLITGVLLGVSGCASHKGYAGRVASGPVFTSSTSEDVITAGTDLVLLSNQTIDTAQADPGRVYPAQVTRAILNASGMTIVPAGSPAELVVVSTTRPGAVGTAEVALAVRSITVNGVRYPVVSSLNQQQSSRPGLGANARTAETVGGGALLGTLVGAIAGGGTGALVGAGVGAVGGGAVNVLTRGRNVRVPAETVLDFRLDQPLLLSGYHG